MRRSQKDPTSDIDGKYRALLLKQLAELPDECAATPHLFEDRERAIRVLLKVYGDGDGESTITVSTGSFPLHGFTEPKTVKVRLSRWWLSMPRILRKKQDVILRPPGGTAERVLATLYSRKSMDRIFRPVLAEMHQEWLERHIEGAGKYQLLWVHLKWSCSLAAAVCGRLPPAVWALLTAAVKALRSG